MKPNLSEKNEKQNKKSGFITGALVLGIIVSIVVFAVMLNVEKNILSNYEKASVVLAKTDIPEGVIITEKNISSYFYLADREKNTIPGSAYTKLEDLSGKIVMADIDKDIMISKAAVVTMDKNILEMKDMVQISFETDKISQLANGTLRQGDYISIYKIETIKDDNLNTRTECYTKPVWQDIFVFEVFDESGLKIENEDNTTAAKLVTVLINKEDITEFYTDFTNDSVKISKNTSH